MESPKKTEIYTKPPEKKSFFNFQIDWRILFALFILVFLAVVVPSIIAHNNILINNPQKGNNYGAIINIVYFCYFFYVINYFILTYTICIYFARVYKKGPKGGKGEIGERGSQGKSSGCDICTTKTSVFKRQEDAKGDIEIVDKSILTRLNKKKPEDNLWVSKPQKFYEALGVESLNQCRNKNTMLPDNKTEKDYCVATTQKSDTYVNGAIVGYGKNTGDIYSLQFMEDSNKKPNKNNVNNRLLNGYDGRLGNKKIGINNYGVTDDFTCPPGSGIYRIDSITNEEPGKSYGIAGLKFYCRDVVSGKDVKSKNSKNEIFHGVYFGNEPTKNAGGKYRYKSVTCPVINTKPSFVNGFNVTHGKKINGIEVNSCSFYNTNDKVIKE